MTLPAAVASWVPDRRYQGGAQPPEVCWDDIAATAPRLAATMRRYLGQLAVSLRPRSVDVADSTLRIFAGFITGHHPEVTSVTDIGRSHIEAYKRWLPTRPGKNGKPLSANTRRQRLGTLRIFFERIIEWGYDDAPTRVPVFSGDLPKVDDPLPKFLDDPTFARLMQTVTANPDPLRRLVVEVLARTGLRTSELCALERDAVVQMGEGHWLRVPLGKLHNDRYIPLHPHLVHLIADYRAAVTVDDQGLLLLRPDGRPLDRHVITRILNRVATTAGIDHIHAHQLRHTLATQAINRGMTLEAIAALLGHRSLRMTLVYARLADRTLADEYHSVSQQIEGLYNNDHPGLPASAEGPNMRRLRTEVYRRMLGNGWCTRPIELDCTFESICEGCTYFQTDIEFKPTLQRQADHATHNGQTKRAQLYQGLLIQIEKKKT